jgi:hypothetical protein
MFVGGADVVSYLGHGPPPLPHHSLLLFCHGLRAGMACPPRYIYLKKLVLSLTAAQLLLKRLHRRQHRQIGGPELSVRMAPQLLVDVAGFRLPVWHVPEINISGTQVK